MRSGRRWPFPARQKIQKHKLRHVDQILRHEGTQRHISRDILVDWQLPYIDGADICSTSRDGAIETGDRWHHYDDDDDDDVLLCYAHLSLECTILVIFWKLHLEGQTLVQYSSPVCMGTCQGCSMIVILPRSDKQMARYCWQMQSHSLPCLPDPNLVAMLYVAEGLLDIYSNTIIMAITFRHPQSLMHHLITC